jgi:iron complex transport system ATP-binding protein
MLSAENISCYAGNRAIVDQCSLHIRPGTFTAIVGPNGAGKTSLLKILAHENTRYRGCVKLNGVDVSGMKHRKLSQLRAVLPQHTTVNFPFTIEQIIQIGRYPHLSTTEENSRIVQEVVYRTGLNAFQGRNYHTLSGGEKQRVQMARVMAQVWDESSFPKYLLLDEPTSSLDLSQQHSLLSLAKEFCKRNIGVVAILHDLNLAAQYADEVLFMKQGKTTAQGLTQEIMTAQNIEKTFDHPVRVIFDDVDGYPIIYPVSKMKRPNLFDKTTNSNYVYEQHSN